MKAAPQGTAGPEERGARRAVVLGLVAALGSIVEEIGRLSTQIRERLAAHPDAAIFRPLFRDPKTTICPATVKAIATALDVSMVDLTKLTTTFER